MSNQKRIIILGASRYYLKSIESARIAGYYVIVVDRNSESEGFKVANKSYICDISNPEKVLEIAKKHSVSAIVPLNDIGVPVASFVSEALNLPGISKKSAIWATNKEEQRKRWIEMEVPCPKVVVAREKSDIYQGAELVGYPCILKPAHGMGGASRGVVVVNSKDDIDEAIDFSQSFYEDKTTLIETFIDAKYEHSAEVLIYENVPHVIAISDKIKTALPYRVDKNVLYPSVVKGEQLEQLKNVIINSVKALELNCGAAHVELATTTAGFVLFELGARCGGGGTPEPIVHYSTGINEFVEMVRILSGDKPENLEPLYSRGCNYHFITPAAGIIKSIKGTELIPEIGGVLDFEFFKKPGDMVVPVTVGTERSGFIITAAETRDEAYNIGLTVEKLIEIEYE
jgi:biotin carboxylase